MATTDDFIQCLIIKNGLTDRHFVHCDDIHNLSQSMTSAGRLKTVMSTNDEPGMSYYAYIRKSIKTFERIVRHDMLSRFKFLDIIKRAIKSSDVSEIVIVAFEDRSCVKPRYIGHSDWIMINLSRYYSPNIKKWLLQFADDEFSPKKQLPVAPVQNHDDGSDDEQQDVESDTDSDDNPMGIYLV